MSLTDRRIRCVALLTFVAVSGCRSDPVATSRRFSERADRYMTAHRWKEAIVEYGNAIKAQPNNADVYYKRAWAYGEVGDLPSAYQAYARAADLSPSNVDAHLRAARLLLEAGEFDAARLRAARALEVDPKNADAHLLIGNALAGLNELSHAIPQIEEAIRIAPHLVTAWLALGAVCLHDGREMDAKMAFEKAIALDPDSSEARLWLANVLWATGDPTSAEHEAREALSRHPDDRLVRRALAAFYLGAGRLSEAEPHLKWLATDDAGRLQLADFYFQTHRFPEAAAVLEPLTSSSEAATSRAAQLRMASVQYASGDKAAAYRRVDALIAERPHRIDARLVKTRMLLADHDPRAASAEAAAALTRDSGSAEAHYLSGLAAVAGGDVRAAERSFQQVIALNPRTAAAHLQLARLKLERGKFAEAVAAASQAAAIVPEDPNVAVVMARSLRAKGDLAGASDYITTRIRRQPNEAAFHTELGWVQLAQLKWAEASGSFGIALRLEPSSSAALDGLVAVDLARDQIGEAREHLNAWRAHNPTNPHGQIVTARLELVSGNPDVAMRILDQLVVAAPGELEAYALLGTIYAARQQIPQAIAQYQALANRSKAPAGAWTMIGLLEEARGNRTTAQASYERALVVDSENGTAANNLAWMYAADGRLDDALRLASDAERLLPNRPEPKDTLGWVKYQEGLYWEAGKAFEQAVSAAPDRATYQYHLGLARLHDRRVDEGRRLLRRALDLGLSGPDADAANKALQQRDEE